MLTEQNMLTLAKPFELAEHGFKSGNVYLRKSAIRRRLSKVDLMWTISAPEFVITHDDVVIYRGSITVGGVTRSGLGSGIIQRFDSNKKELEGYNLARNVAKAHKEAVTDILARAAVEFGVGNYLRDKPAHIKEIDFADWLAKLSGTKPAPVTQQPAGSPPPTVGSNPAPSTPPVAPVATWATVTEIEDMLTKATSALNITWLDISLYTGIADQKDYAAWNEKFVDRADARDTIIAEHRKKQLSLPPSKPKKETDAVTVTD
jgi:hypothetical protein